MLKSFRDHRLTFNLILAIPAIALLTSYFGGSISAFGALHPAGETAVRLTIIAMMISPLRMVFPQSRWLFWILRRRRDIGIAAFLYALLHIVFYMIDKGTLTTIIAELNQSGIWTGWLAMLIFVPLAITSNNLSVRLMGRAWKGLQRLVYPAAILTLVHWLLVSKGIEGAVIHFAPLAALEIWRIYKISQNRPWSLA